MIRAYHFVGDTLRDGSPVPADGEWLEVEGPLVPGKHGLHWCRDAFYALHVAPGNMLCLVDAEGDVIEEYGNSCSRRRRIVARIDATSLLREFFRWWDLEAVKLRDAPDALRKYVAMSGDVPGALEWYAATSGAWEIQRAEFNRRVQAAFAGWIAEPQEGGT